MYSSRDEIVLILLPSVQEIRESQLANAYMGGLAEFYDSVNELYRKLDQAWRQSPDLDRRLGPRVSEHGRNEDSFALQPANGVPSPIIQLFMSLGTCGLGAGIYALLRIWLDERNGRKLRIKIGDFEVEATQMSETAFIRFVEQARIQMQELESAKDVREWKHAWLKFLKENGFVLIPDYPETPEMIAILKAVSEAHQKVADSLQRERNSKESSET